MGFSIELDPFYNPNLSKVGKSFRPVEKMSEELINKGISIVGEHTNDQKKPVVVVGTARGGTSMVAGVLAKLGVFMGDSAVAPVFEDVRLSEKFESGDLESASEIANEYTERHGLWGWKRPSSINYLMDVEKALNKPRYIFIYKDILSIAQRNSISMLSEIMPGLERALVQYGNTISFLKETNPNAMLVSYDKAASNPEYFVDKIIEFLHLEPSEERRNEAIGFITPNPTQYLDASRITKAKGRIDSVSDNKVKGWAMYIHQDKPAEVDIYLDDEIIGTVVANSPRDDLIENLGRSCGFIFDIPEEFQVKKGQKIRARVRHEVADLTCSPFLID